MFSVLFLLLVTLLNSVDGQNLCDNPIIFSANRFHNNTVRLYRNNVYWELHGLPEERGFVTGPFGNTWDRMWPVRNGQPVITNLHGSFTDATFKIDGQYYCSWYHGSGTLRYCNYWMEVPVGGLYSAFHNDDPSDPMFIGFANGKVYYYQSRVNFPSLTFLAVGDRNGYVGGMNNENYPTNVDAAFSYNINGQIYAYLFNGDRYCVKDLRSGPCNWKESRQLFGCTQSTPEQLVTDSEPETNTPSKFTESFSSSSSESPPLSSEVIRTNSEVTDSEIPPVVSVVPGSSSTSSPNTAEAGVETDGQSSAVSNSQNNLILIIFLFLFVFMLI